MTDAEKREAARQFFNKWNGKGKEDEDDRSYWVDILSRVMGVENATDHIDFQKKVIVEGNTKRIDAYISETKVIIEQKSLGVALDKKGHQSGGIELTPYEQAKRYNDNLPYDEKARWIVTSNFAEIWIYDMNARVPEPVKLNIMDIQSRYNYLDFLIDVDTKKVSPEVQISKDAGEIVGKIYDALIKQYDDSKNSETLKSLNKLCVRLVFCLYAEDSGIFGRKNIFHNYMKNCTAQNARVALRDLFRILNQEIDGRDKYLKDDNPILAEFPYVNGGLFEDENIEIPPLTDEILQLILNSSDFEWENISPTIFGGVFESTLNPETRRSGGMHYTSIENIHKVIDPLFLDELREEFHNLKDMKTRRKDGSINPIPYANKMQYLNAFQDKLASLKFMDPACGSGNFLTETFLSIRRIENAVIREKYEYQRDAIVGQISLTDLNNINPIKVSISQFYGIEINDFAVTVAKTALWIAESQMLEETKSIIHNNNIHFLPLKTNAYIKEGNALTIEWNDIVNSAELSYIMGNPPFIGSSIKSKAEEQKKDKERVFGDKKAGKLDYVACWYKKATDYINGTQIKVAFVSTNSITQGEQVRPMWEDLLNSDIYINFAYRTFVWNSEASNMAHVHCVIIGFSKQNSIEKYLFEDESRKLVTHINGYLVDAPNFYIESRGKAPNGFPKLTQGNKPWDNGGLILSEEERDYFIQKYPNLNKYIKLYLGSKEFLNNIKRYCLWLVDAEPHEYINIPEIKNRFKKISELRSSSPTVAVQQQADTPYMFSQIRQPDTDYILIPETSSSARRYIPMGFMSKDVIASNSVMTATNADLYLFGILESNVHMSWVRTLCGRMKSDYRYSPALYNNFPWPNPTDAQRKKIEKTAQGILDARNLFPNSSLADLYDSASIQKPLLDAHNANNRAVMELFNLTVKSTSEADCVAALMKLYSNICE